MSERDHDNVHHHDSCLAYEVGRTDGLKGPSAADPLPLRSPIQGAPPHILTTLRGSAINVSPSSHLLDVEREKVTGRVRIARSLMPTQLIAVVDAFLEEREKDMIERAGPDWRAREEVRRSKRSFFYCRAPKPLNAVALYKEVAEKVKKDPRFVKGGLRKGFDTHIDAQRVKTALRNIATKFGRALLSAHVGVAQAERILEAPRLRKSGGGIETTTTATATKKAAEEQLSLSEAEGRGKEEEEGKREHHEDEGSADKIFYITEEHARDLTRRQDFLEVFVHRNKDWEGQHEAAKALAERMIHVEYWVRVLYFRIQRAKPPPLPTSTAPPSEFIGDCPHVDVPHVDVAEDEEAISVVQDGVAPTIPGQKREREEEEDGRGKRSRLSDGGRAMSLSVPPLPSQLSQTATTASQNAHSSSLRKEDVLPLSLPPSLQSLPGALRREDVGSVLMGATSALSLPLDHVKSMLASPSVVNIDSTDSLLPLLLSCIHETQSNLRKLVDTFQLLVQRQLEKEGLEQSKEREFVSPEGDRDHDGMSRKHHRERELDGEDDEGMGEKELERESDREDEVEIGEEEDVDDEHDEMDEEVDEVVVDESDRDHEGTGRVDL